MSSLWRPSRRDFLAGLTATGLALGCGATVSAACPAHQHLATGGTFDEATKVALELALDSTFKSSHAPGVVAGVWRGQEAWVAVRGRTEMNGADSPSLELHTRVGSITKTMVGTLILQLVDEGRLSLDDTVEKWFPKLPLAEKITVRMLGDMSSGIASYTFSDRFTDHYLQHPTDPWTPEQLLDLAFSEPRPFEPGLGFQYCNTNFVMLGVIVETLRSATLAQVLRAHIFEPLDMPESSYPYDTDLATPYWHGYTLQGTPDGTTTPVDATHWTPTFGAGAGQAVSTLHDLRNWARALGRGELLKPETQATRLQANNFSRKGKNRYYAFATGFENGWVAHAGTLPGYNTQVAYLPAGDITIVVMANSDIKNDQGLPAVAVFDALAVAIAPHSNPLSEE